MPDLVEFIENFSSEKITVFEPTKISHSVFQYLNNKVVLQVRSKSKIIHFTEH